MITCRHLAMSMAKFMTYKYPHRNAYNATRALRNMFICSHVELYFRSGILNLLLLLVHDFGVNHAFVLLFVVGLGFALRLAARWAGALRLFRLRLRGGGLVKLGAHGLPGFVQLLGWRI